MPGSAPPGMVQERTLACRLIYDADTGFFKQAGMNKHLGDTKNRAKCKKDHRG